MTQYMEISELYRSLIETFEEVKKAVQQNERRSRGGLMLGLQEIGASLDGFIGAYYPVASNIIIVNKTPLRRILETDTSLLVPYVFHILLHEYIHSLGFLDEKTTGRKTYEISKKQFGEHHIVTEFSTNIRKFFPNLVYPIHGWTPLQETPPIELVQGFDFSSTHPYIT
ncbi:MAG: hypothetical protein BV458_00120 [Thermoplasmata archaeon M9B2D]|nr:MAG: hypothetical protein BV458_00120 [Thermoplasmata archaeon M9B2D]